MMYENILIQVIVQKFGSIYKYMPPTAFIIPKLYCHTSIELLALLVRKLEHLMNKLYNW